MHLIHQPPSDASVRDALIKEIKTGWEFFKQRERIRELRAAREAQDLKNQKELKGLGRCIAQIPADDYFLLRKKYGGEVATREFMQYFQRKYPHLSPHKI